MLRCKCCTSVCKLQISNNVNWAQNPPAAAALDFALKWLDFVFVTCFEFVLKYNNLIRCCAPGAQDSSLKLWDLRKLKNFKTITLDNNYEVRHWSCFSSHKTGLKIVHFVARQIIFRVCIKVENWGLLFGWVQWHLKYLQNEQPQLEAFYFLFLSGLNQLILCLVGCFNFGDTLCDLHIQLWHVFASECPPECHRFSVPGEIPGVWPEWYLLGCRRVWHPCLHLQAVVWGSELYRWWQHKRTTCYPMFILYAGHIVCFFAFVCF